MTQPPVIASAALLKRRSLNAKFGLIRCHVEVEVFENERHHAVRRLLYNYVQSPSLRHLRDANALSKVVREIVEAIDHRTTLWRKWEGHREPFLKSAAACWIPIQDLLDFLNGLPGPQLTKTDVEQRLRSFYEEPFEHYPNKEVRSGCLEC